MKFVDTLRLATRNLINNFAHSILAIVAITILFTLIMTVANFCWVFSVNMNKNIVESVNLSGVNLSLSVPYMSSGSIDNSDIEKLVELAKKNNIDDYYDMSSEILVASADDNNVEMKPYIGGLRTKENYKIIEGEHWQIEDDGKDYIWLSKTHCDRLNVGRGDIISLKLREGQNEVSYTIKGITNSYSYIDFRYFGTTSITIGANTSNYSKISELKQLKKAAEGLNYLRNDYDIWGNYQHAATDIGAFVYGLGAALIAFSIGVSIVSLLNTLKINIEQNNATLGMMKSLGAKNRNIKQYVIIQIGLLLLIGTVLATIISCLIGFFGMGSPMKAVMGMLFQELPTVVAVSTFWFVLPLITLVAAGGIVFLASIPMLRRYVTQDAVQIINEGDV